MARPKGFAYWTMARAIRPELEKITLWQDAPDRLVYPPPRDELDDLLDDPKSVASVMGRRDA